MRSEHCFPPTRTISSSDAFLQTREVMLFATSITRDIMCCHRTKPQQDQYGRAGRQLADVPRRPCDSVVAYDANCEKGSNSAGGWMDGFCPILAPRNRSFVVTVMRIEGQSKGVQPSDGLGTESGQTDSCAWRYSSIRRRKKFGTRNEKFRPGS